MTGAELVAARQTLGLTRDQFAAELGIPPHSYAAWENGTVKIPVRYARDIAYRAAIAERQAALSASGLPECAWVRDWEAAPQPEKLDARLAHLESLNSHAASCLTCRARDEFVAARFGPLPEAPIPAWLQGFRRMNDMIGRLPEWARPAAWGALALGALTSIRVVLFFPRLARTPGSIYVPLAAILAASGAGAVGGLVYYFVGRPLRRVPVAGPYFAGIASVLGYMGAIALGAAAMGKSMVRDWVELVIFLVLSVGFGLVLGFSFFRRLDQDAAA